MRHLKILQRIAQPLGNSIRINKDMSVDVLDANALADPIETIVQTAVLGDELDRSLARWLIRTIAIKSGVVPASIHDLYLARGRGETRDDFTVPAINLRAISFYTARAVFRAAMQVDAQAIIFEIARSEIGYTGQPPAEYTACLLGAALAERYKGPVFIQGDHFQISASRFRSDPETELASIRKLAKEAILAGFYNIDIDTSTLVDLSQPTVPEQEKMNYTICAQLSAHIRGLEPEDITVSLGGEIGEIGSSNSTEAELRAFMEGYNEQLNSISPGAVGLSKISIQTGTSHGGVVLPDGSIASVKVDFDTLSHLGRIAKEYGMGGAVQHGASTLPEEAFPHFVKANALEVHLATNFQNIFYDRIPDGLREEVYAYLRQNHSHERKTDETDEQFYYKTRKRAFGPFKRQMWLMPPKVRDAIEIAWEDQFRLLFDRLNISGTRHEVEQFIRPIPIYPDIADFLGTADRGEDVSDLAD